MLEQVYWVAGIVVAVVTVFGLFRWKTTRSNKINQNSTVSGDGNSVNQRVDSKIGEDRSDQ